MLFKKKKIIPRRPWVCGTPLAEAIEQKDKNAVKKAYDYQYSEELAMYEWDLKFKDLTDTEKAQIQIEIGELRKYQKENGFGPWYHENDIEDEISFD
jgi:hypothetical protein